MKTLKLILFFAVGLVLFSCKKNINFPPDYAYGKPPAQTVNFSAKVNGALIECSFTSAILYTTDNTLQVIGSKGEIGFNLAFVNFKGVGTYDIAQGQALNMYLTGVSDPFNDSYIGESGNIKVTAATDKSITGTFEFTATSLNGASKAITDGKFTVNYSKM